MLSARSIHVRGVVQGVGFRPFVYRLAQANALAGWVHNAVYGVEIHLEGTEPALDSFICDLRLQSPPASSIAAIDIEVTQPVGLSEFTIRENESLARPTARISPDLAVCDSCLAELFDSADHRYQYPYINCTNCGPRYSVILRLPYERPATTMHSWPLDDYCEREYRDPGNRRFHAQPVACPACGPAYSMREMTGLECHGQEAVYRAAELLAQGSIVAIKGLGGYHLACDAKNATTVSALRERKFRKEQPFALMVKDLLIARGLAELSGEAEKLIVSTARPIVVAPAKAKIAGVAPENHEIGIMLPYTPLHYLLFAVGAPEALVMTSGNRSNEPIAYEDDDAVERLSGIADAFLIGERPIARRVDDSVMRSGVFGPVVLRRSRGYAPGAVAQLPFERPILAFGSDLKNTVTLVVNGQAFVSQHIGDLENYQAFKAFKTTIQDLLSMYGVCPDDDELLVVHDAHPQYVSTLHAQSFGTQQVHAVQHHRAHVASVLAERETWDKRVLGVSFDGTGYGDDGSIWGGEIFTGSIKDGFERVAHLHQAVLPGGDAAARYPVQSAAGFLSQIEDLPNLMDAPFHMPMLYRDASKLAQSGVRCFTTSSVGRLFDAAAALLGFVRGISFEGQAAMWLENLARSASSTDAYPFPLIGAELDFRPLLQAVLQDRLFGRAERDIARAFQRGIAQGLSDAVIALCQSHGMDTVVLSGGVFQNELLMHDLKILLSGKLQVWINHVVPSNDGGIGLGQAALAAFAFLGERPNAMRQSDDA